MSEKIYPDYDFNIKKETNQTVVSFKTNLRVLKDDKYYIVPYSEIFVVPSDKETSINDIIDMHKIFTELVYQKFLFYIPNNKNDKIDIFQISEKERIIKTL